MIDITCWTKEEAVSVIENFDFVIQSHGIPDDGTICLRYILVRLFDIEDLNPKYIKPDELFKRLSNFSLEEMIDMIGYRSAVVLKGYCEYIEEVK